MHRGTGLASLALTGASPPPPPPPVRARPSRGADVSRCRPCRQRVYVQCVLHVTMLLLCVLLLTGGALADEDEEGGKCERITLPLCQNLGYNWTSMPNMFGHATQKEAEEAMSGLSAVVASGCAPHARLLLCAAYAPLCSAQVSGAVSACRDLCERVSGACGARLAAAGRALPCDAFPPRDTRLCLRPPGAAPPPPPPAPAPRAEPAPPGCPDEPRAALATAVLAGATLLCTCVALGTFAARPARVRYPARACVWLAATHAGAALAQLARGALCAAGEAGAALAALDAALQYLTLAGDAWFASAGAAWYLAAASGWSTEALERRAAAYLHAAAWGWAGAWLAAARGGRGAGALAAVARGAALAAGAALALAAAAGAVRLAGGAARGAGRAAGRAAGAAALYAVLAGAGAAAAVAGQGAAGGWLQLAAGAAAAGWAGSREAAAAWRRALCPPRKPPPPPPAPLLRLPFDYQKGPLHVSIV